MDRGDVRVLHVDDEPYFADLTATFLEREDSRISVTTATSAAEGLDRLADDDFECIVADYDMPGRNGIEFLRALRDEYPDLPFVLLTGKGSEGVASDALSAGATDYLRKGGGSDQYEVLANRIGNAVEQYRSERRAANLERIRELASDVKQVLIRADSTTEIETQVCRLISETDPYVTACIAGVDREAMEIVPRTWTGDADGYFEELEMAVDEGSPGRHAPGGRAFHDREIAVSQSIQEDDRYARWREPALQRGFRSLAVVPIEYEGELHGLLATFACRPNAFDRTEQEFLGDLADDIAHALHSRSLQTELEQTNAELSTIMRQVPAGLILMDHDDGTFRYRRFSRRMEELSGLSSGEIRNETLRETLGPGDGAEVVDRYRECVGKGEAIEYTSEFEIAGEEVIRRGTVSPVSDDGEVEQLVVVVQDITEEQRRRERLERTTARLEALFDNSPDMINVHDGDGNIINPNSRLVEATGYDAETLAEMKVWELDRAIDPDEARALWDGMEIGDSRRLEGVYRRRDGSTFPVEVHVRHLSLDGEDRFVAIARDISERKEHERELERARDLFREAERLGDLGAWEFDATGRAVWTDGTRRIHEVADDYEPSVETGIEFFHPEDRSDVERAIEAALDSGESCDLQARLITAEDDERWVRVRGEPLEDGETVRGYIQDITARKAREQQLERQNDLFRKVQKIANIGAWEYDIREDRTVWTDHVYEIHDRPRDRVPENGNVIDWYHPDDRARLRGAFRDAVETGDPYDLELRLLTRDGETRWVRTRAQPQREDGEVVRIRGAIQDITDRKRRKRDLRKKERRYQSILNDPNILAGILDTDGTLLEANRTAMEYIDAELEDVVGEPFWETPWWPEELRSVIRGKVEQAASGEYVTYEADLMDPDGAPYAVSGVVRPVTDDDGQTVSLVVSARDITEREKRERELRREREFVRQSLDALDDLFYVLDTDGTIQRWNQEVVDVTGYDPAELDGLAATEIFPESERRTIADAIGTTLRDGETTVRADLLASDGERIPYEWSGARLTDTDGETSGVVGIGRDISQRRHRERRFRALVEESNDVISIVDADGRFQYLSPSIERILGYDPDETVGDMVWEYIHPDDRGVKREMMDESIDDPGATVSSEYRVRHANGSWCWMEASARNLLDTPSIGGFVVNSRDVTAAKERERVLRIVTRMLRHNLRNEINVIRGQAEMIRSEASGTVADDAAQIVDVSDGLVEMAEKQRVVTELLQNGPAEREIDVGGVLQQVASTVGSDYPEATITVDCPDELFIELAGEFELAISELVTNAIVHDDSASPDVAITVTRTDGTTRIDVADNGPPIPDMERNILIDEVEMTPVHHGSGFGLWLVKLITFRLGGTIVVEENFPTGNVVGIEFSR